MFPYSPEDNLISFLGNLHDEAIITINTTSMISRKGMMKRVSMEEILPWILRKTLDYRKSTFLNVYRKAPKMITKCGSLANLPSHE